MSDKILLEALRRLNQPEKFEKYYFYLQKEWLATREDLYLASQNEMIWGE